MVRMKKENGKKSMENVVIYDESRAKKKNKGK